jgi:DNA-binding PadR family transcriptional regulator
MIAQEFLLLGLLKESPRHGYEIKKNIKEILSLFAGVDAQSVYYPLGILEKKGFIVKHESKQGKRPRRFVYALTEKGETRFAELLHKSLLDFKRPQFSLDLSLYFLRFAQAKERIRRLRGRIFILNKLAKELKQMLARPKEGSPSYMAPILEHNVNMLEAESAFLSRLIKTL